MVGANMRLWAARCRHVRPPSAMGDVLSTLRAAITREGDAAAAQVRDAVLQCARHDCPLAFLPMRADARSNGSTMLHYAAAAGAGALCHDLCYFFGADPAARNAEGKSAFHYAAAHGHAALVGFMHRATGRAPPEGIAAPVAAPREEAASAPLEARSRVRKLIHTQRAAELGALVDADPRLLTAPIGPHDSTPLHYCAEATSVRRSRVARASTAPLTPHSCACVIPVVCDLSCAQLGCARVLLERGAAVDVLNAQRKRPLDFAVAARLAAGGRDAAAQAMIELLDEWDEHPPGGGDAAADAVAAAAVAPEPASDPLRVTHVTLNIAACKFVDREPEVIAALLAGARPHVVALQEVDRGTRRSGGADQASRIAAALQARVGGEWRVAFGASMPHDGGDYGASRPLADSVLLFLLSLTLLDGRRRDARRQRAAVPRAAACAYADVDVDVDIVDGRAALRAPLAAVLRRRARRAA